MKIVFTHLDFNAYFPLRLRHFQNFLKERDIELFMIEILGKPVLYNFDQDGKSDLNIECLLPQYTYDNVPIKQIHKSLLKRLDEINPDVIFAGAIAFPPAAAALKWAKHHDKGIILFNNTHLNTFDRNALNHIVKKQLLHCVDAFFCPSPSYDETLAYWGFKKEQIFYGLNVTDNSFWNASVVNKDFSFLPQEYFITISRHVPFKNLSFLLKAYKQYVREGGEIPLVMVGDGPEHEALVHLANRDERIIFLPFLPYLKLKQVMSQAKALYLPSFKMESWGMVVNEAMASGKIVAVSTECGCCDTLVKEGINGYAFSPYNMGEIVKTMHAIEALSAQKQRKMEKANLDIIADWDVDRFSEGCFNATQYVLTNKKRMTFLGKMIINLWKGRLRSQQRI